AAAARSRRRTQPGSIFHLGDMFAFADSLLYPVPGTNPAQFRMQPFFIWYAPRIPHQPLRSPKPIDDYLFGPTGTYRLGGLFDLGALCSGGVCPPTVSAMNGTNFGTDFQMYGNVYWVGDGLREIRQFLVRESQPHCVGSDGKSVFDATQASCTGTWAASVTPDLVRNTIIMHLSDNGWHLPNSKHEFTEYGYRTRLIVFDPRALASISGPDGTEEASPPPRYDAARVHSTRIRATAVGYALGSAPGSQLCPMGSDGSRCDGKDIRNHLADTPGGPASPESLRRSLCGHDTQRSRSPSELRYLLTREGSVGRCTNLAAAACGSDAECPGGRGGPRGHRAAGVEPGAHST